MIFMTSLCFLKNLCLEIVITRRICVRLGNYIFLTRITDRSLEWCQFAIHPRNNCQLTQEEYFSLYDKLFILFFVAHCSLISQCKTKSSNHNARRNSLWKRSVTNANHQWLTSADTFVTSRHYDAAHDFSIAGDTSERQHVCHAYIKPAGLGINEPQSSLNWTHANDTRD